MKKNNNEKIWVLHICNALYPAGGVQSLLMNYYRNIDRNKIQFAFVVQRDIKFEFDKEIEDLGGKIYYVPEMQKDFKGYMKALSEIIKNDNNSYKIAHAHMNHRNGIALAICKKNGVPIRISHAHNLGEERNLLTNIRVETFKLIGKMVSTDFVTCSIEAGKYLFGNRINNNKSIIMKNAINVSKFAFNNEIRLKMRRELNIKSNEFVLGYVGNYSKQKNLIFALKVFSELRKVNNNSKFLVIGTGEENEIEEVNKIVKLLEIEDNVMFLGTRLDVNYLMQAMDALIIPSLFEGLGIVAIEAQAAGLEVYASENVPDAINITNLAKHIELIKGPKIWAKIINEFRGYAREKVYLVVINNDFDICENTKKIEEYYISRILENTNNS